MDLLQLDAPLPDAARDPVVVLAMDGWTDAGEGGTRAVELLIEGHGGSRLGAFDGDALFDYRDRRPAVPINRGVLGAPTWPSLELHHVPVDGRDLLVVSGGEPDLRWRGVAGELTDLAEQVGAESYLGLGSVPGPVPHTRPARLVVTSTDESAFDRFGRPHEEVVVPGSCQVLMESTLGGAGLQATGFWARIPHYVATDYPEAAQLLLRSLGTWLDAELDVPSLEEEVGEQRRKLDGAAEGSPEVQAHIRMLEEAYDQSEDEGDFDGPLPTGDQIAAELERFLRDEDG